MATQLKPGGVNYRYDSKIITDGVQTYATSNSRTETWMDSRSGTSLPNWRYIIKSGGNATTGFSAYETVKNRVPVSLSAHITGPKSGAPSTDKYFWSFTDDQGMYTTIDPNGISLSKADTSAREQFIQSYRSRRTSFQSGVFLGELNQVVSMIRRPASSLRREVDRARAAAKKRQRGLRGKQAIKAVSDSWLEFAFGVKPLVKDVQDALSLANACPMRYVEPINVFTSIDHKNEPQRFSGTPAPGIGYPTVIYTFGKTSTAFIRYKGAACAERYPPPPFSEQFGLSWSNVLPTVWELIPYSFLIDYFSNIGRVIEGISTGIIKLSWGCRSAVKTSTVTMSAAPDNTHMANALGSLYKWSASVDGGGRVSTRKVVERNSVSEVEFGLSDTQFKVPAARSLKWLNIAALAISRTADRARLRV
jgi:hypothetical protein